MLDYFGHPFSSYTWKGEIALIEKGADYVFRPIDPDHSDNVNALKDIWPLGKFPVLKHGGTELFESSIIIEYVDGLYSDRASLIPADLDVALNVRLMDRVFDNHVMTPMQAIVNEHLPFLTDAPDPARIEHAKGALNAIYDWLDQKLVDQEWATPCGFTMADCAAAPALFYADWVHEIPEQLVTLRAYRARLLARPSVKQVVDAARPYRLFFPLGAPDRD